MYNQFKAREPIKVEDDCVELYQYEKWQEVKFSLLCKKDRLKGVKINNINIKGEIRHIAVG